MTDLPDRIELGDGAFLRVLVEDDVTQAYVDGLNDPQVNRFLIGPRSRRQTFDTVRAFVAENAEDDGAVLYGLYVDGALRGTVRVHGLVPGLEAAIGIALFDRSIWGRGWARRCIAAVTDAALAAGAAAVVAGVYADNEGSRRAFAGAGYERDELGGGVGPDGPYERWVRRP